ncbi:MAG: efflux RND transporter permease subunit [Pseudomonadota bacterium]
MIAWFARNAVAANLLMVAIALGGLLALKSEVTMEVFPAADPRVINVAVSLRGATPEDAELGIAVRVEEAVQDLEGIDRLVSRSFEGGTSVYLEVEQGYDARSLLDDVKSRVDAINTLPVEAERPVISLATRRFDVIEVVVGSPYGERETREFAERIRSDLLRLDGITQAELEDVRRYEIAIEASQDQLRRYGIGLADVAQAIRGSSLDVSAGNVRTLGGDVLIRSKGQAYTRTDFESIVVKTNADGSIIRVGDVARVLDGFEEASVVTRYNGMTAAVIGISRVGDQSAIDIADKVKAYIDTKQDELPAGVSVSYWDDDSQVLRNRLGLLTTSAIQGSLLVIILLTLFLRPAVAIWVFIGIPMSFLGAFIAMWLFGVSLNVMSAFGFILVLGIVVDDAIVTGENVYRHMRDGDDSLAAAIEGTREVAVPVTFGVLTTIMAFVPLLYIEGRLGNIFGAIPAVVIPVLLFSLIESKFILPAHLKHVRIHRTGDRMNAFQNWQRKFANGFENLILRFYKPVLGFTLRHRYSTLAAFVGIFIIIVASLMSGWTRFVFIPRIESETATASLQMPIGTPFEVTDRHIQTMLTAAQDLQAKYVDENGDSAILAILSNTGSEGGSTHTGRIQFEVQPPESRTLDITTTELIGEWRRAIGTIPGAEQLNFRAQFFRSGSPVDIQLAGNSLDTLNVIGEEVKKHLATYPGVFEIADSMSDGKEEIRVELKPQGHVLGLSRSDILAQVGYAFRGFEAQRIQRGRDDVRVLVRLPAEERATLETLNDLLIETPEGRSVPLSNVATLIPGKGPSQITRIDRYRVLNVTAEVDKETVNMTALQESINSYVNDLLIKYPGVTFTTEGEARQQRESFGSLQLGLIVVLFGIYCLLALPLKSYTQPLIVMSVIPFGLIGAVAGHWIMGYDVSILSLLGLMALIGVVVNDSLVLVDYINQRRRAGLEVLEAVRLAGVARFRPVMLTSLTTFFGLSPLLLEKSTTAQFLKPMAVSLAFGILFATFITLVMVPSNVMIAHDLGRLRRRIFGGGTDNDLALDDRTGKATA